MSAHDVSLFVRHCLFVGVRAGDTSLAKSLTYILPVWAPLIAARRESSNLSLFDLTSVLTSARWATWDSPEPEVVRSFLLRAWVDRLEHADPRLDFNALATWLNDVDPLLERWAQATSPRSMQNLADFVLRWDWLPRTSFIGAKREDEVRLRSRTETWLTSTALEKLRGAIEIEDQENLIQAIEVLECMRIDPDFGAR